MESLGIKVAERERCPCGSRERERKLPGSFLAQENLFGSELRVPYPESPKSVREREAEPERGWPEHKGENRTPKLHAQDTALPRASEIWRTY